MISRLRRADAAGVLPVLVAMLILLPGIGWGLPIGRDKNTTDPWGYDEIAPMGPLIEANGQFRRNPKEGDYLAYPLFHYLVLDAAYAPYLGFHFAAGSFRPASTFPYGMADPAGMLATLTLIARGVSVLMAMGCVWFVYRIARNIGVERWAASGAAFAASLSPLFVYYGRSSNLDAPYAFWVLAAIHAASGVLFAGQFGIGSFIRFGVFSALTVATKDQAYAFLIGLPPLLVIAVRNSGVRQTLLASAFYRPLWLGLATSLLAFALANNLVLGSKGFIKHVNKALDMSKEDVKWSATFAGQFGLFEESLEQLISGVGPLIALSVLGIVRLVRERRWMALAFLLLPLFTHHVFVLARILYCHPRFMLLPVMIAMIFAALGFRRKAPHVLIAILGFIYLAFAAFDMTRTQFGDARYDAEVFFAANAKPGQTVETYTPHSRLVPRVPDGVNYVFVPEKEINATQLNARKPDYVLITDLSEQKLLTQPETQPFVADLLAGKLGYRVVFERNTPSLLGRWFVRGLAPKVIILRREAAHE